MERTSHDARGAGLSFWKRLGHRPQPQVSTQAGVVVPQEIRSNIERLGSPDRWEAGLALVGLVANPFAPAPVVESQLEEPGRASPLQEAASLLAGARVADALAVYERILAGDPGNVEAWFRTGVLRLEEGDTSGALQAWEHASTLDPTQWVALLRRGMTLASLGRNVDAARSIERALPYAPAHSDARIQLSVVYATLGWCDLATGILDALPERVPGWWAQVRRDNAGMLAAQERQLAVADGVIASGKAQGPGRQVARSWALLGLGRIDECEEELTRLLAERPHGLRIHEVKAAVILRVEGAQAAVAYVRGISEHARRSEGYNLLLARMEQEAGRADEALKLLASANEAAPGAAGYRFRARAALTAGNEDVLSGTVAEWLSAEPGDPWASRFAIASARGSGATARLADVVSAPVSPATMLPVVQFWGGMAVPDDVVRTMASWRLRNPATPYLAFSSSAARVFIAAHSAPEVLACFDRATHPAMQSDIFRLAFLQAKGGIYIDADEECLRPLHDIQAAMQEVEFAAWLAPETPPYVYNGFLAARAGCPLVAWALGEAVRGVTVALEKSGRIDIWQLTGPGLMTRAVGRFVVQPGFRRRAMLLTDQEYRAFGATKDLAYKETKEGNWRL